MNVVGDESRSATFSSQEVSHSDDDSSYQAMLEHYDLSLWSSLRSRLRRTEFFLAFGRKDLAWKWLANTRAFCDEYKGTEAMERACQDTEDIIRHWPLQQTMAHGAKLQRRVSDSQIGTQSQRTRRSDSNGSLFDRLMKDVQTVKKDPRATQSPPASKPPSFHLVDRSSHVRFASLPSAGASNGQFESIDTLLPRLRESGMKHPEHTQQASPSLVNGQARPKTIDRVNGWGRQLPNCPSQFKDSEEASPRRRSFPQASPTLPAPPPAQRSARKASIHSIPQPLLHEANPEPQSPSNSVASADISASNYSRRQSQDESSTVLSDTPSLAKLASQIHPNPFLEAESPIASRIRKLSTEGPFSIAISTTWFPRSEQPESPSRSPLSQTFTPDDVQPDLPSKTLRGKTPPPLALNTLHRPSASSNPASSWPHTPSPLREGFSLVDLPQPQLKEVPKRSVARHESTFASRIPRLTARTVKPPAPVALDNTPIRAPAPSTPDIAGDARPTKQTGTKTSAFFSHAAALGRPPPTATVQQQQPPSHPQAQPPAATAPPPTPRRRDTSTRVSQMAMRLDTMVPPRRTATGPPNGKARPRWQVPGKTTAKAATAPVVSLMKETGVLEDGCLMGGGV